MNHHPAQNGPLTIPHASVSPPVFILSTSSNPSIIYPPQSRPKPRFHRISSSAPLISNDLQRQITENYGPFFVQYGPKPSIYVPKMVQERSFLCPTLVLSSAQTAQNIAII